MASYDKHYWATERCVCGTDSYDNEDVPDRALCADCKTQKAKAERQAAERSAQEEKALVSPWRPEILAIRSLLHRIQWAPSPEERVRFFGQLLSTLHDYRDFLVASPGFRQVTREKIAESRTNPEALQALGPLLDQTDTLLADLPYCWAKERLAPVKEELMAAAWAPARVERWVAAGLNPEAM